MQRLCHQVLRFRVFCDLRTKRQLGYTVQTSVKTDDETLGLVVFVRSERKPSNIVRAIRECLDRFAEELKRMTDQQFQEHKNSLAADLLEEPYTLEAAIEEDDENFNVSSLWLLMSVISLRH
jgi:insulysin